MEQSWVNKQWTVFAEIEIFRDHINIYAWSSHAQGQGHTKTALQEMRAQYPKKKLVAHGIGESPEEPSYQYWLHMHKNGFVDVLVDDDSNEILN